MGKRLFVCSGLTVMICPRNQAADQAADAELLCYILMSSVPWMPVKFRVEVNLID